MQPLVELITLWQKYIEESSSPTVEGFCVNYLSEKKTDRLNSKSYLTFAKQLGKTSSLVNSYFKIAIKGLPGIDLAWYFLLDALGNSKEVRKTDIVSFRLLLEPTTTIDILNRMLKSGLISERIDPTDKRARLIKITDRGSALLQKMDALFENITSKLFSSIDANDISRITSALNILTSEQMKAVKNDRGKSIENIVEFIKDCN